MYAFLLFTLEFTVDSLYSLAFLRYHKCKPGTFQVK